MQPWHGDRYLTIVGAFNLGGVVGNGKSIVKLPAGSNTPVLVAVDDPTVRRGWTGTDSLSTDP